MSTELKRGDKQLFGCYWGLDGPHRVELGDWVWTGETWAMPNSPIAQQIAEELKTKGAE